MPKHSAKRKRTVTRYTHSSYSVVPRMRKRALRRLFPCPTCAHTDTPTACLTAYTSNGMLERHEVREARKYLRGTCINTHTYVSASSICVRSAFCDTCV